MVNRDLNRKSEQYTEEAAKIGAVYLGAADEGYANYYRKYRLQACNHEINALPCNVRANQVACSVCQYLKINNEAEKEGLLLIDKVSHNKNLYMLPCGHWQGVFVSAVRSGEWLCQTCHRTYFDQPSALYLLHIKTPAFCWLKLGYSNNLTTRLKSYKLVESQVEVLLLYPVATGRIAIKLEQSIHSTFFSRRLDPSLMKQYHTQDGYTECYPVELKAELLLHISEICAQQENLC